MAVSFERYGRLYYLDPGRVPPTVGTKVLVPTDAGPRWPRCVWAPQWVSRGRRRPAGLRGHRHRGSPDPGRGQPGEARAGAGGRPAADPRARPAHEGDRGRLRRPPTGVHRSTSAPRTGSTSARWSATLPAAWRRGWSCGRSGPRDEARLQGGIGPCGRDLCCATFLKDFEPVSVRMAKDQDLPVNPLRIAGACGRLMCCLKYEHPLYQDFRERAQGRRAGRHAGGTGHRRRAQRAGGQGRGEADGGRPQVRVHRASVCGSRQGYEARYGETAIAAARLIGRCAGRNGAALRALAPVIRPLAAAPAVMAAMALLAGCTGSSGSPGRQRAASGRARTRPVAAGRRGGAAHDGGLLRAEAALAALRRRVPVRTAAGPLRLPAARLAPVLTAGDPAARQRPGEPDRVAGGQPRRSRRVWGPVRARRPQRDLGRRAGPVRRGRF